MEPIRVTDMSISISLIEPEIKTSRQQHKFVTAVSQELRTPLAIILFSVELIACYSLNLPDENNENYIQQIKSAALALKETCDLMIQAEREFSQNRLDDKPENNTQDSCLRFTLYSGFIVPLNEILLSLAVIQEYSEGGAEKIKIEHTQRIKKAVHQIFHVLNSNKFREQLKGFAQQILEIAI